MTGEPRIERLAPERLVAVHASPVEALPLLAPFRTLRLGPEEWLCLDVGARQVEAALGPGALVLDVGDSYAGWQIDGVGAQALMACACALDLAALASGSATRTLVGAVTVVLSVVEGGYELRVDRSYADWFADWITRI